MIKFLISIIVLFGLALIVFWIIRSLQKKRIYTFLSNINISEIDAITGFQFEEIIAFLFKFFGYKTSLTKKSGDYGVDVFATDRKIKYCIQTKLYYNHSVGSSAIQQINTAKNYFLCDFAVVITNSKYSRQSIDMATKLNVILIDRQDLLNILRAYKRRDKKYLKKLLEGKKNV